MFIVIGVSFQTPSSSEEGRIAKRFELYLYIFWYYLFTFL